MKASVGTLFHLSLETCKARFLGATAQLKVSRPATLGDGIERWDAEALKTLVQKWENEPSMRENCGLWVPSSGAATRMFGSIKNDASVQERLWNAADDLAFGQAWRRDVAAAHGEPSSVTPEEAAHVLYAGLDGLPKGMVTFHLTVEGQGQTAFEAHLKLWKALDTDHPRAWFTVQEDHKRAVAGHLANSQDAGGVRLTFPIQSPETDTPVMLENGDWLRDDQGEVERRPGGHGALLPLLEEVDAKFLVIRNIDNAPSPDRFEERLLWTKAMLAETHAWELERREMLQALEFGGRVNEVKAWLRKGGMDVDELNQPVSVAELVAQVKRPMRLVGVVRNEGHAGGGPFWVQQQDGLDQGMVRPQIVESVELNHLRAEGLQGTHFNPVDMVCVLEPGTALEPYVDHTRYLKSPKLLDGQQVHILEHPGLWNGGMSGWLTRFVEIPTTCFQPVKTALDLIQRH